jgi:hypothetical protein
MGEMRNAYSIHSWEDIIQINPNAVTYTDGLATSAISLTLAIIVCTVSQDGRGSSLFIDQQVSYTNKEV